jgi:hypothetical protein
MWMLSCISLNLISQILFAKTYKSTGGEYASSVVQTADGGYACAGIISGAGGTDFLVLKIGGYGELQWAKVFAGPNKDYARCIIRTSDGGYAVAGATLSFSAGDSDLVILKLEPSGELQWARSFGGPYGDGASAIIQTSDEGYLLAGGTMSFGAGNSDLLVVKLGPAGDFQWAKTFGGPFYADAACSAIQTYDGGYLIGGWTNSFPPSALSFLLIKLSAAGDLEWAKSFSGTGYAYSMIQTSDGGYTLAGRTSAYAVSGWDFMVLKLDGSGNPQWARTFGGDAYACEDWAYSIIQSNDGGYFVVGGTTCFGAGGWDILILKLDADGNLQQARTFGGASNDCAYSVIQAPDGGCILAGETYSFGPNNDLLILKIGPDGNYPGCLTECQPTLTAPGLQTLLPSLSVSFPSGGADCTPTVTTPNLTVTDVCTPVGLEESDLLPGTRITCSLLSGGLLFNSPADLIINIYSVDGRVAYSGQLRQGENRISLGRGVYLWIAGGYMGKAAVR